MEVEISKKRSVYSTKPFEITGANNFEKHLPPPYLIGFGPH